jgi:hypothetical protein
MRNRFAFAITFGLLWALGSNGLAEDANTAPKAAQAARTPKPDTPTPAQLQARLHRTMAALIEAQSAENPDPEKVKQLTDDLQSVQARIRSQAPATPYVGPGMGTRPWGGPGLGYGPAWGGPGRGPWRGSPGMGYGRGAGRGVGPGWGRAPGYGRGAGWGRGTGYGRGAGWAPGLGRGLARGWAFVDEDRDGVCDNFERIWGQQK